MLITSYSSLKALACIALFASNAAAVNNSSSGVVIEAIPNPTATPNFQYRFNVNFKGGKCSAWQQAEIRKTMNNVAGLADRAKLWEDDAFHDWQKEVNYWFGTGSASHDTWIKNNFLRVSTALKKAKDGWINTYVYVGCDYSWSKTQIGCNRDTDNNVFNYNNNYGFYHRWDTIYWNFCPDFWSLPLLPAKVQSVLDNPGKNIHYMENYYGGREQWLFPGVLSIRSVGITKFPMNYLARIQSPGDCWRMAGQSNSIQNTLVNYMSYFYAAMSITIPELNTDARPVISRTYAGLWSNMDDINGTEIIVESSALPAQESAGTEVYDTASATADAPPDANATEAFSTIKGVAFPTLADTAHASTENCFTFLPSMLVLGRPSEKCDCGTTTAELTTRGASTGCALSNDIFGIKQFPTGTGSVTSSSIPASMGSGSGATSFIRAPSVTPAPPIPTRAFEIMLKRGEVDEIQLDAWSVYSHAIGEASKINACDGGFWWLSADADADFPTDLGAFQGSPYSGCFYQGPATAPGSVTCPDLPSWTQCSAAPTSSQLCYNGAGYDEFYAQVECEF